MLNLDDRIAQLQLTQGTLNVRVRRLDPNQVFEVDTPNLAFTVRQPGEYRIDGGCRRQRDDASSCARARARCTAKARRTSSIRGSRIASRAPACASTEPARRAATRRLRSLGDAIATALRHLGSARYVSPDVVGYQDLDAQRHVAHRRGLRQRLVPESRGRRLGALSRRPLGWVDPWGWTWVDDAPVGLRRVPLRPLGECARNVGLGPGPVRTRAYYAPALVAFVGGNNFQLSISSGNVGGVAWFPLGPRDVYRPSYAVSRGYFENVNVSNTVINTTVINNYYNNTNVTNVVYANRQVPGADRRRADDRVRAVAAGEPVRGRA